MAKPTKGTKHQHAAQLELMTGVIESLLTNSPKLFLTALNNVCAHGGVFDNAGLCLDSEDLFLKDWFDSLDKMHVALNRIMTSNYYEDYAQLLFDFEHEGFSPDLKPYPYKKITTENDKRYLKTERVFLNKLISQKQKALKELSNPINLK